MRERERERKKKPKDINRISRGLGNALNSHLSCALFTTTGNKSKQSFDALTVEEGGKKMEMFDTFHNFGEYEDKKEEQI